MRDVSRWFFDLEFGKTSCPDINAVLSFQGDNYLNVSVLFARYEA